MDQFQFHRTVMIHVVKCLVHEEARTVYRNVKGIPPHHEQGIHLLTDRFVQTINGLTLQFVKAKTHVVWDSRCATLHTVTDAQSLQR